jgi:hypothetical protein
LVVISCMTAGCGGGARPAAHDGSRERRGDGARYLLPAGWHAASRSLTPLALVHPSAWRVHRGPLTQLAPLRNQLALATFEWRQRRPDTGCSPVSALRARRPSDGFVFVYEYAGLNARQLARFPRRQTRLRLARGALGNYECFGRSWLVRFRDGGRAFQAHVYGPPQRRREALVILDSLRVQPAP